MNKQEFIKKYRGAIPDAHNRTPWKRWEDIEKDMDKDLDELIREAVSLHGKLFCTECKIQTGITIDGMCPSCDKIRNEKENNQTNANGQDNTIKK